MKVKNKKIVLLFLGLDISLLAATHFFIKHLLENSFILNERFVFKLFIESLAYCCTYFFMTKKNIYLTDRFIDRVWRMMWRTSLYILISLSIHLFLIRDGIVGHKELLLIITIFLTLRILFYRFLYFVIDIFRGKGRLLKNVLIVGIDDTANKLGTILTHNYAFGYHLKGYVSKVDNTIDTIGGLMDLENIIKQNKISEFFVTFKMFGDKSLVKQAIKVSISSGARVRLIPINNYYFNFKNQKNLLGIQIINPFELPLDNLTNRILKRIFDILFSSIIIITILSWLIPLLSISIYIESKGSPFFIQKRAGKNNKIFNCLKFRSMAINKGADNLQATKNDKRITKTGKFLRKYNIDELPQFFNVLMGSMSVVGPRPHMLSHDDYYAKEIKYYKSRHFINPGVTGWAQVNGYRGETDELWKMEKRVEYDFYYIKNQSFLFDLKIIFLTLFDKNSYKNAG